MTEALKLGGERVLISNDDGYQAVGLKALRDCLRCRYDVVVVAPERDRSGASNSLTLMSPLRVQRCREDEVIVVDGTPADCVHLALGGLLDREPGVVVSGINAGANLGDDVLYSGTVGAAMEGRHLALPPIAISLASSAPRHFDSAGSVVVRLLEVSLDWSVPQGTVLNVNVPDLPSSEIKGVRITRLGRRKRAEPIALDVGPGGTEICWIGAAGSEDETGPGTDFQAVREGYVSVTPLHTDLTAHDSYAHLASWLGTMSL